MRYLYRRTQNDLAELADSYAQGPLKPSIIYKHFMYVLCIIGIYMCIGTINRTQQ